MYGWGLGATGLNLFVRRHNLFLPSVLGLFMVGSDLGGGGGGGGGVGGRGQE